MDFTLESLDLLKKSGSILLKWIFLVTDLQHQVDIMRSCLYFMGIICIYRPKMNADQHIQTSLFGEYNNFQARNKQKTSCCSRYA